MQRPDQSVILAEEALPDACHPEGACDRRIV